MSKNLFVLRKNLATEIAAQINLKNHISIKMIYLKYPDVVSESFKFKVIYWQWHKQGDIKLRY